MRSCASRGARSPGNARNNSSCSRSERVRWRADMVLSAARLAGLFELGCGVAPRRQDDDLAGVGCRDLGGGIDPRLKVFNSVDDATAELRIARAGAVDAVLFERADGEADEARGLWRAQVALRQTCEI